MPLSTPGSNAFFDMDGDGIREKTGWVTGGDGFLVRDINNNGNIDNIGEMIGTSTQDAFTFLRTLDDNKDGKITATDAAWKTLKVWVDADGDGVTDTGELKTLAELGMSEFNLSDKIMDTKNEGNNIYSQGSFTRNGQTLTSQAVFFGVQSNQTKFTPPADYVRNIETFKLPAQSHLIAA